MSLSIFIALSTFLSIGQCNPIDTSIPPALVVKFTGHGLDLVAKSFAWAFPTMLNTLEFEDQQYPISKTQIHVTDLAMRMDVPPTVNYFLDPPNKLTIHIASGPMTLSGKWRIEKSVAFTKLPIKDNGKVIFHINDVRIIVNFELGNTYYDNGLPALLVKNCISEVGGGHVQVRDARDTFVPNMMDVVAAGVRTFLQLELCNLAKLALTEGLTEALKFVPHQFDVAMFGETIRYTIQPKVYPRHIELLVRSSLTLTHVPIPTHEKRAVGDTVEDSSDDQGNVKTFRFDSDIPKAKMEQPSAE